MKFYRYRIYGGLNQGKDKSLNMEKRTPKSKCNQTNEAHLPHPVNLIEGNVTETETTFSTIHDTSSSSSRKWDDNKVIFEETVTDAVAINDESEPITLHQDIKSCKQKGEKLKKAGSQSMHETVDYMVDKIDEEVDIFIRNKNKKEKKRNIKVVMKYISACLNTNGGIVKLNNRHWEKATGKDLDEWYGDVEKQLFSDSTKFIELKGMYKDQILTLRISPLHYIFSVDTYLYFPRNTDIIEVEYLQAIDILHTSDISGSLSELPAVEGDFEYQKTNLTLSENDQIQFKEISKECENVPGTFSSTINKYISAFINHKGGRIFFGIEDKKFKVVGVNLTKEDKESITKLMYDKMEHTMKWGNENRNYVYGTHWRIDFLPVKVSESIKPVNETIPTGQYLEVIMVSVCRYPGGVFTGTPKAYYIREEDRTIQQFTFKEWKNEMISSYTEKVATKGDIDNLREDINRVIETEAQRHPDSNSEYLISPLEAISLINVDLLMPTTLNVQKGDMPYETDERIEICNVDTGSIVSYYMETKTFKYLREELRSTNQVFLTGMDGAGKSQLAQKYANEQREQRCNYIVWKLNCQNADLFRGSLQLFIRSLQCKMRNPYFTEVNQSYGHTIASELAAKCQKHSDLSPILILDDVTKKTLQIVHGFLNQLRDYPSVKVIATTKINPGMSVRVLEVNGFTEDESFKFLSIGKAIEKHEEGLYLDLARKISCNPLGLYICRTFMTNHRYSIMKMNRFVDAPCQLPKIENVVDKFEGENKIFQCLLNVLRQIKGDNKDIFELFLVLIFLDTHEEVPVIILEFFSQRMNMADDFIVEKFLKEITNASFGKISGYDDFRSVKTYQVIIRALDLELEANDCDVIVTKRIYLQRLLESFMMLISHDNRVHIDLKMNKLMIPHAIVVVKHAQELLTDFEFELSKNEVIEFKTPLMYVSHLIGYTLSVEGRVFLKESPYLTRAKQLVFSLFNVQESQLESTLHTANCDMSEAMRNAEQILEKLDIFQNENTAYHSQFVKWFVVGKRRSKLEMESIHEVLNRLTFSDQVTEVEYIKLVKTNKALCFDDMQSLLFIELVVSVFNTYGRQMFYLDDAENDDQNSFLRYLKIAYCISSKIKERNPNICWERTCKTSGIFKFVLLDHITENVDEYWQKINEEFHQELMNLNECRYYQFGLLKNDEQLNDKVILFQLFAEVCISLYKTKNTENIKKSIFDIGQDTIDSLVELKEKLINLKTFNSVLSTIAKWYSCIRNKEKALQYFKETKEYQFAMNYENVYKENKQKALANNTHSLGQSVHCEDVQHIFLRHGFHIKNAKFFEAMRYLLYPQIQTHES